MWREHAEMALMALRANRLRSALTILGIVIGVSSVIMILSLGRAAEERIAGSLEALGSSLVLVYPTPDRSAANADRLTERDARALARSLPDGTLISRQISGPARVIVGNRRADTVLQGVDENYSSVNPLRMEEGELFDGGDVRARASVVILGSSVADRLFDDDAAIGRRVRLNGSVATVVGVATGTGNTMAGDQSDFILAPITTARQRYGVGSRSIGDNLNLLLLQFPPSASLQAKKIEIEEFFRKTKNPKGLGIDPVSVSTTEELSEATGSVVAVVQSVLAAIASISLVVGGIGILNIMLVSVTERTREIGVRLALGARPSHIRDQFLVEAAILCAIGGFIGVLLTSLGAAILGALMDIEIGVSLSHVMLALFTSISIGLAAGYLPAKRASTLSPVEALRRD